MARDIVEMEPKEFTCPHCGKPVLMKWQMADYGYGESNPQFIGLEKPPERFVHNPVTGSKYPVQSRSSIKNPPKPMWGKKA